MPKISNEILIEIRNKIDIIDVISAYLPLEQRGKNFFAVCPFHDDHNPSMSISPEKQIYTCFVCGASGNVFTFLMDYEKISFMEAVKLTADKIGLPIDFGERETKKESLFQKDYDIYDLSNKYFQNNLKTESGKQAKDYLQKRDITPEIIKEFQIGLSLANNGIYKLLKKSGYIDKDLIDSGICSSNDRGMHDTFINRIMFPISDIQGQVVAFSGRAYKGDNDNVKYINSKESKIFKKGQLIYNYHRAKDEIRRNKQVIIVEGFMDVIGLYKQGIKNVLATMGTAITKEQAHLIKRMSREVILCFDGDSAGEKATINCSEELVKLEIHPKIIRLEENLDPDDYIAKKGIDSFMNHIENPLSLLEFKRNILKKNKNFNNPTEVSSYINEVIKELAPLKDEVVKEITLKKLSEEINVSYITLNNILKKEITSNKKETKIELPLKNVSKKFINKYEKAEQNMIAYMLKHKEVIKIYENNDCYFPTQEYRYLANEISSFYHKYNNINIADFMVCLGEKKELIDLTTKLLTLEMPEKYSQEEIHDYIDVLHQMAIKKETKRLTDQFKSEVNPVVKADLAKQIVDLKKGVDINDK